MNDNRSNDDKGTIDMIRLESRLGRSNIPFKPGASDDIEVAQLEQFVREQTLSGATEEDLQRIIQALEEERSSVYQEREEDYIEKRDNLYQRVRHDLGSYLNTFNTATIIAIEAIPGIKFWNSAGDGERANQREKELKADGMAERDVEADSKFQEYDMKGDYKFNTAAVVGIVSAISGVIMVSVTGETIISLGAALGINTIGNTAADLATHASMNDDPSHGFRQRLAEEFEFTEGAKLNRRYDLFKDRAIAAYHYSKKE